MAFNEVKRIDEKRRVVLPAKFKKQTKKELSFLELEIDDFIVLKFSEKKGLNQIQKSEIEKIVTIHTYPVKIDAHKRIIIPVYVYENLKQPEEVRVVGDTELFYIYDNKIYPKIRKIISEYVDF